MNNTTTTKIKATIAKMNVELADAVAKLDAEHTAAIAKMLAAAEMDTHHINTPLPLDASLSAADQAAYAAIESNAATIKLNDSTFMDDVNRQTQQQLMDFQTRHCNRTM